VLTLPTAARLLAQAQDLPGLAALAHACGFSGDPAELDSAARLSLGLHPNVRAARVVEGRGILRALCVDVKAGTLTRDAAGRMAIQLQQRSPFSLW
jgi:hypothetical protein